MFLVANVIFAQEEITYVDGLAFKNYTTVQLNAITNKVVGDTYFDVTKGNPVYWNNNQWNNLTGGGLSAGDQIKLNFITVTQAVDLDDIETKANSALQSIQGGTNVTIDNTNPLSPIINVSSGSTVDNVITNGSTNPVENNAIFDALTLKANDNEVVKLTGNQIISGNKTFSNNIMGQAIELNNQTIIAVGESSSLNGNIDENKGFSDALVIKIK